MIFLEYEIDLLDQILDLTKLHNEVKDVLNDTSVIFTWLPNSEEVCPSSMANYFSDNGRSVKLCQNKFASRQQYGVKYPEMLEDVDEERFLQISEYIGMVLLGCELEESDYNSYQLPKNCRDADRYLSVIHSKGFITQNIVRKVIDGIMIVLNEDPSVHWIALSIIFHSHSGDTKLFIITKDQIHSS